MNDALKPLNLNVFLEEDIGSGDITAAIIPEAAQAYAEVITREAMVMCGQAWFNEVFRQLNSDVLIDWLVAEGDFVPANALLCTVQGQARALLTGERTALNWV